MHRRVAGAALSRGMNGRAVARAIGVSPSYVSKVFKGHLVPSVDVATRMGVVFQGIPLQDFLDWAVQKQMGAAARRLLASNGNPIDTPIGVIGGRHRAADSI